MPAKDKHRETLLTHLANPDNDFPNREGLAKILGINKVTMYAHFTPAELTEIERTALEMRRAKYTNHLSSIDRALIKRAREGDQASIKLAYQRFENWKEGQTHEISGPGGKPIETKYTIEFINANNNKIQEKT